MFDETKNSIEKAAFDFTERVRDSFGRSVNETAFQVLLRAVHGMKAADDAAKLQEAKVRALMLELKMII